MNNIENKINNLFDELENTKVYKNYIRAKIQLESNREIMDLIKKIKRYQKISVNNKDEELEKELKKLYKELNSYPIYQSYQTLKEELEHELRDISDTFSSYFEKILKLD